MKIIIASDTYYPGVNGASYFAQRLAVNLVKRGHDVYVIASSGSFKNKIFKHDGVTICGVRSMRFPYTPRLYTPIPFLINRTVKRYVRDINPDIIHTQTHYIIGSRIIAVAKKFNIPVVGTNHFMPENLVLYLHLPKFIEDFVKYIAWRHFASVYRKLDAVTAPTRTAANVTKKSGLDKDVIPVSCGIDLKRFNPKNNGGYLKDKFNIPKNRKIVLYTGRLDPDKRISYIIKAFQSVAKNVDAHLVLVGLGNTLRPWKSLTKKLNLQDRVTFTGFVSEEDFPNIYTIADLFIIAGYAELQSIVTMEAMASGLPVVAVNATALPELVHDGENGYLFKDKDVKMMADLEIKILSDRGLREKMSQKSLEIIQAHDINKSMEKFESLYRKAIESHKK